MVLMALPPQNKEKALDLPYFVIEYDTSIDV